MSKLKKTILGLCISLSCVTGYSQSAYVIDFSSNASSLKNDTIAFKSRRIVRIDNINLRLYKVDGGISQQNFNTQMPEIFKTMKLPGYLTTKLPAPAEEDQNAKLASMTSDNKSKKKTIEDNLETISRALEKIKATEKLDNTYKNLFEKCGATFDEILKEKQEATKKYLNIQDTLRDEEIAAKLKESLHATIDEAVTALKNIETDLPTFTNELERAFSIANFRKAVDEYDTRTIQGLTLTPTELLKQKEAKKKIASFENQLKELDEKIAEAKGFVTELKKFDTENKVEGLVNNYKMINRNNYTYYSDEVKATQDEVKVEIKITTEKALPCDVPSKKTYKATYITKGGVKVDFSSGVFVNTGNEDFLGRELEYKTINDTTVQIQSKDGGKRLLLSVGALMHIYWRSGGKTNFAISPGLSTTTAFDGINFHLGGSVIFGGENRIVLSAGFVFREAKVLDRNYNYNTNYTKSKMPDSPPSIKVFPKNGGFFSITYNWSRLKGS